MFQILTLLVTVQSAAANECEQDGSSRAIIWILSFITACCVCLLGFLVPAYARSRSPKSDCKTSVAPLHGGESGHDEHKEAAVRRTAFNSASVAFGNYTKPVAPHSPPPNPSGSVRRGALGDALRLPSKSSYSTRLTSEVLEALPCVIFCDPGRVADTEVMLVTLRNLVEKGSVQCKGVVANLRPQVDRAQLLRGTLDCLGLHDVPCGIGTNGCSSSAHAMDTFSDSAKQYMPARNSERVLSLPTGSKLLLTALERALPKSLVILCLSSLKDVAIFLRDHELIFVSKVKHVLVMGGECYNFSSDDNAAKSFAPDASTVNEFDRPAAEFLYARCQFLGIPLLIVPPETTRAIMVPKTFYDELAESGSPVGWRIREAKRNDMQKLWKQVCTMDNKSCAEELKVTALDDDSVAQELGAVSSTPRLLMGQAESQKKWFAQEYCDGDLPNCGVDDPIWDYLSTLTADHSVAILAAVPEKQARFFAPKVSRPCVADAEGTVPALESPGVAVKSEGEQHHIVMGMKSSTGIAVANFLRDWLVKETKAALRLNTSHSVPMIMFSDPGQDMDDEVLRA